MRASAGARRKRGPVLQPHIAFLSSNQVWGGSEELWRLAAENLIDRGVPVSVYKPRLYRDDPVIARIAESGSRIVRLPRSSWPMRVQLAGMRALQWTLKRDRTALAVISQGLNFDGWRLGKNCARMGIPYVLISQKADDLYWPNDWEIGPGRKVIEGARANYFVSHHNLRLTAEQFAMEIPNADVVRNPFKASWDGAAPWPGDEGVTRLACIGRLDMREKGQDLLLRVLAMPKWRDRPLHVTIVGSGHNREGLAGLAQFLGIADRVTFNGHLSKPETLWETHHGLVLASRCEGLPLVVVEAMLSGRPPIVTNVGGNAEVIDDGVTGFLASSPTESELDHALERAWSRRADWEKIGRAAQARIRTEVPADPAAHFADRLLGLACS